MKWKLISNRRETRLETECTSRNYGREIRAAFHFKPHIYFCFKVFYPVSDNIKVFYTTYVIFTSNSRGYNVDPPSFECSLMQEVDSEK